MAEIIRIKKRISQKKTCSELGAGFFLFPDLLNQGHLIDQMTRSGKFINHP
jgi:hypothetical protein